MLYQLKHNALSSYYIWKTISCHDLCVWRSPHLHTLCPAVTLSPTIPLLFHSLWIMTLALACSCNYTHTTAHVFRTFSKHDWEQKHLHKKKHLLCWIFFCSLIFSTFFFLFFTSWRWQRWQRHKLRTTSCKTRFRHGLTTVRNTVLQFLAIYGNFI